MKTLKLKQGGVKLPYTTINTEDIIIQTLPIPELVRIPLIGEDGEIGIPLVKEGDMVVEGQEIAHVDDLSFHASISGKVSKIEERDFLDSYGEIKVPYMEILFQGKLINWKKKENDLQTLSKEKMKELIRNKGVVNLTMRPYFSIKEILQKENVKTIIINGLDNGPYLSYFSHLVQEKLPSFFKPALEILRTLFEPKKITLALFERFKDLHSSFSEYKIPIKYVKEIYPQSLEPLLVKTIMKKKVMTKEEIIKENILVIDLATLYAIYQAVVLEKPLIDRVLTIDGQLVQNPGNYLVRVGTPIETVLQDCNIFDKPSQVISGNPLNGLIVKDYQLSCHKKTEAILVNASVELQQKEPKACVSCSLCEFYCPVGLIPSQALFLHNQKEIAKTCILCGICDFFCPSSIQLLDLFKEVRKKEDL